MSNLELAGSPELPAHSTVDIYGTSSVSSLSISSDLEPAKKKKYRSPYLPPRPTICESFCDTNYNPSFRVTSENYKHALRNYREAERNSDIQNDFLECVVINFDGSSHSIALSAKSLLHRDECFIGVVFKAHPESDAETLRNSHA